MIQVLSKIPPASGVQQKKLIVNCSGDPSCPRAFSWAIMSRPFRACAGGRTPVPGRCPGLVCHAPSGLIPISPVRQIWRPCPVRVGCGHQPTAKPFRVVCC